MEQAPPACARGECEHGTFPHSIVTVAPKTITRTDRHRATKVTETLPARAFVVCILCRHWQHSGAAASCTCECHRAPKKAQTP